MCFQLVDVIGVPAVADEGFAVWTVNMRTHFGMVDLFSEFALGGDWLSSLCESLWKQDTNSIHQLDHLHHTNE